MGLIYTYRKPIPVFVAHEETSISPPLQAVLASRCFLALISIFHMTEWRMAARSAELGKASEGPTMAKWRMGRAPRSCQSGTQARQWRNGVASGWSFRGVTQSIGVPVV